MKNDIFFAPNNHQRDLMNTSEVSDLFTQWNNAIQTRDPKVVTALYASDATLLPTISNIVRHNHAEIEDYFALFLPRGPIGKLLEENIRVIDSIAINSGVYAFSFDDGSTAEARYSFVYKKIDSQWKIIEHHSSVMPEQ